jgi:hypothetical protein
MNEVQIDIRQELDRRLSAVPLQPFDIVTADRRFPVVRKFQAAVGERIVLWVPPDGEGSKRIPIVDIQALGRDDA